jgi:hypothetical protein
LRGALLLAVQSARAAEIALYQMPTDKLCTEAANKLDHDKLLVELVGRMVRAGQLPVDTGGDSRRISLSYSRADIADFLYDDLVNFHTHLTDTDYRLVSYRSPSAVEIRQHPELGKRAGYLLFPPGRFAVIQCFPTEEEEEVADKNARPMPKAVLRCAAIPSTCAMR